MLRWIFDIIRHWADASTWGLAVGRHRGWDEEWLEKICTDVSVRRATCEWPHQRLKYENMRNYHVRYVCRQRRLSPHVLLKVYLLKSCCRLPVVLIRVEKHGEHVSVRVGVRVILFSLLDSKLLRPKPEAIGKAGNTGRTQRCSQYITSAWKGGN